MPGDHFHNMLITAIAGLPTVLDGFLNDLPSADPRWDVHPEPGRFSLREIVAHLADWDAIWIERLVLIRDQESPQITPRDESELAIANDYAHADPDIARALIFQRRSEIVKLLRALGPGDWARTANHPLLGSVVLRDQATYVALHDAYHTQQIARWLMSFQVPAKA